MNMRVGAALLALASCSASLASPFRPLPDDPGKAARAPAGRPVAGLPFAQGRAFATLDEYLAFRRERGAIDLPWYKSIGPDLFELQTTRRPAPPREVVTRAELARRFGFAR